MPNISAGMAMVQISFFLSPAVLSPPQQTADAGKEGARERKNGGVELPSPDNGIRL